VVAARCTVGHFLRALSTQVVVDVRKRGVFGDCGRCREKQELSIAVRRLPVLRGACVLINGSYAVVSRDLFLEKASCGHASRLAHSGSSNSAEREGMTMIDCDAILETILMAYLKSDLRTEGSRRRIC